MTVRRVIHEDLSLNTYKKIRVQALTTNQIQRRKSFAHWIKNRFSREKCRSILFSDEKWFDQDGQCNRQNDCVYAESREAANEDFGTRPVHKFPFKVMVWAGITFNGVTDIVILPQKMSFDADFYIENVLPIVKKDGNRLIGLDFTFQQDGAKPHTSGTTIETIESMGFSLIGPDIWPPNSPDLNPLDYFFWDAVEVQLKTRTFNNVHELAQKIKESVKKISLKSIEDAIDCF